jgi:hypothetical protein
MLTFVIILFGIIMLSLFLFFFIILFGIIMLSLFLFLLLFCLVHLKLFFTCNNTFILY